MVRLAVNRCWVSRMCAGCCQRMKIVCPCAGQVADRVAPGQGFDLRCTLRVRPLPAEASGPAAWPPASQRQTSWRRHFSVDLESRRNHEAAERAHVRRSGASRQQVLGRGARGLETERRAGARRAGLPVAPGAVHPDAARLRAGARPTNRRADVPCEQANSVSARGDAPRDNSDGHRILVRARRCNMGRPDQTAPERAGLLPIPTDRHDDLSAVLATLASDQSPWIDVLTGRTTPGSRRCCAISPTRLSPARRLRPAVRPVR